MKWVEVLFNRLYKLSKLFRRFFIKFQLRKIAVVYYFRAQNVFVQKVFVVSIIIMKTNQCKNINITEFKYNTESIFVRTSIPLISQYVTFNSLSKIKIKGFCNFILSFQSKLMISN